MVSCILLIMPLLVSMVLLKCTNFPLVIHFVNFTRRLYINKKRVICSFNFCSTIFLCFSNFQIISEACLGPCQKSFVSQVKNANLSKKFLVSYDLTTIFTNILLQETIDIAINLIFNHNPDLDIIRKVTHFIFNSKFYNQIDGVAIGSSLAPSLLTSSWAFTNLSG